MEWWVFLGSDVNVGITVLRIFRRASGCCTPGMMRFRVVLDGCGISMVLRDIGVFMMMWKGSDEKNMRFSEDMMVFQGRKNTQNR